MSLIWHHLPNTLTSSSHHRLEYLHTILWLRSTELPPAVSGPWNNGSELRDPSDHNMLFHWWKGKVHLYESWLLGRSGARDYTNGIQMLFLKGCGLRRNAQYSDIGQSQIPSNTYGKKQIFEFSLHQLSNMRGFTLLTSACVLACVIAAPISTGT